MVLFLTMPVVAAEPGGADVSADSTGSSREPSWQMTRGEAIPGAVITIVELNRRTKSDENGAFRFTECSRRRVHAGGARGQLRQRAFRRAAPAERRRSRSA